MLLCILKENYSVQCFNLISLGIPKGFSLFRFLFPRKITYSLGCKPFEVQETSTHALIRTVLRNDLFRLREQSPREIRSSPQKLGSVQPFIPPLGQFPVPILLKCVCFFHLPLPSLAWFKENRNHLCWGGTSPPGKQIVYLTVFSQLNWDLPLWDRQLLTWSWTGAVRLADIRNAAFALVSSCYTFCFMLHWQTGLFFLHP